MQRLSDSYMVLHADFFVRSMAAALDFYCTKLGFSVVDDTILQGPIVESLSGGMFYAARLVLLRVSRAGALIELQEFQPASALTANAHDFTPKPSLITILVADLSAHIDQANLKGLHPSSEIFSVHLPKQGSCNVIFYEDPDGNRLEFLQVTERLR